MKTNDTPQKLFFLATSGIDLINTFKKLTKNGKFEVLLFNSEIVLEIYRTNKPNSFNWVQGEYFKYFEDYISQNSIGDDLDDISDFINSRFILYASELNKIFTPNYIPGKIYNAFYDEALRPNPQINFDLPNVMLFSISLKNMAKYVNEGVNLVSRNE